jgi:hypothetical protein
VRETRWIVQAVGSVDNAPGKAGLQVNGRVAGLLLSRRGARMEENVARAMDAVYSFFPFPSV